MSPDSLPRKLPGYILGAFGELRSIKNVTETHFHENRGRCVPIDKYHTKLKLGPLKMKLKNDNKSIQNLNEFWHAFPLKKYTQSEPNMVNSYPKRVNTAVKMS